jgi:hypothetical protein
MEPVIFDVETSVGYRWGLEVFQVLAWLDILSGRRGREVQGLDDGRVVHELPTDSRVQVWIYVAWILKGMHPDASYY